ncbi:MAG: lipoprotein [Nocardioidaceae bacterium]|nr:lipoprotein [Nocardioidaceae bacterium]
MSQRRVNAAIALVAAIVLTACGSSDQPSASPAHNAVDVSFAQQMIAHHRNALAMVELTSGRDLSPGVTSLAADIRSDQTPEIVTLSALLTSWGADVPSSAAGMDDMDDSMGMAGPADLAALTTASKDEFEALWIATMSQHHEGAVSMSEEELADGRSAAAKKLAHSIIQSQEAQISQMDGLLDP